MRAKLSTALSALAAMVRAVPNVGAAHLFSKSVTRSIANETRYVAPLPIPARLRFQRETGLLLRVGLDGTGPYIFAIDTGVLYPFKITFDPSRRLMNL